MLQWCTEKIWQKRTAQSIQVKEKQPALSKKGKDLLRLYPPFLDKVDGLSNYSIDQVHFPQLFLSLEIETKLAQL